MAEAVKTAKQTGLLEAFRFPALGEIFSTWLARADARRELSELSDRMIADIGLDPDEIRAEIDKPFWRA